MTPSNVAASPARLAPAIALSLIAAVLLVLRLGVATITLAPLILEGQAPPSVLPWAFIGAAFVGSLVGAFVARLLPSIARTYSLARLTLAGVLGWPLAWWIGAEASRSLAGANNAGVFAITFGLEHTSLWILAVALVAFLVLRSGKRGRLDASATTVGSGAR